MFRTTLPTPRARRCSGALVAAAAAAMVLTPGVAFAAGQPAGPGSGHSAGAGAGHAGGTAGSHTGNHQGGHSGHATGHTTGHTGAGHSASSHRTGHAGAGHATGHTGTGHSAATGKKTAHGAKTATHRTTAGKSAAASGPSTSDTPGSPGSSQSPSKASSAEQTATVTKLSVSKPSADDGTLTMSARVSPTHRTAGTAAATGTVEFTLDGTSSGPIPLSGGRAMVEAYVGPGEHTASAKYSGDAQHAPSDSGPVSVAGS